MAAGPAAAPLSWQALGPKGAPPVVLCHGLGLDAANMLGLAHAFAGERRVILWDMPGHGGTPAAVDCSPAAMAVECLRVMDAAGVEAADIVGFSFGGVVAQWLAISAPTRVRALVLYGCFAPFHQAAPLGPVQRAAILAAWRLQSWPSLCRQFAQACAATPPGKADVLRAMEGASKAVFLAMSAALFDCFVLNPQSRFAMPLLLMRGENDSNAAALDEAWQSIAEHHLAARQHIIAGAGHCAHNDQPEATAAAITAFLESAALTAKGRPPP